VIYFIFCLLSVCWSDYPFPAVKKWVKAVGDLVMILIVLTDEQPLAALRRLFSRTGFVLLPLSVLLIKYYPNLGRTYDNWSGAQMAIGATLDKNLLGVITFVLSLGALWHFLEVLRSEKRDPDRRRHLLAQGALLFCGIWLLANANSATSTVCFLLGAGLMLATRRQFIRRNPSRVHLLVLGLAASAAMVMLVGRESATHALGRNSNLTGRTEIWAAVIPMASNPLVGAGFESFWLSPSVRERLMVMFQGLPLNEAHDGYIEVYLNLGWIGVGLMVLLLLDGYRRAAKAFRREPGLGGLLLAYVLTAITYSITEAGFRMLSPNWIFFLLAATQASCISHGVAAVGTPPFNVAPTRASPARNALNARPTRQAMIGKSSGQRQLDFTRPNRRGNAAN
jgi:O-antigen ligase